MRMQAIAEHPQERMRLHCGAERASPRGTEFVFFANFVGDTTFEPFGHIYSYRSERDEPWMFVEVESFIHRATAGSLLPGGPNYVFLLSVDGEFWALSEPGQSFGDTIPGAGTWEADGLGDTNSIDLHDGILYVGGARGQVYRRENGAAGTWEGIGANLRGGDDTVVGTCVARDGVLYALARRPADRVVHGAVEDVVLYAYDETGRWEQVTVFPNQTTTAPPVPSAKGDILVALANGTILSVRPDGVQGVYGQVEPTAELTDLAMLGNVLYGASGLLHAGRDGSLERITWASEVSPSPLGRAIGPLIGSTHLSMSNGAMLSVGRSEDHNDIVRLVDGKQVPIEFPVQ